MPELAVIVVLGLLALGAVLFPLIAGRSRYEDAAELDADVQRYREAIAADTVCTRCLAANPAGSRFCADCGRGLAEDD